MTTPFDILTPQQAALIRRTVTAHLSDDEHALFIEAAQRSGLDPFARHIYPLREGKSFTIQATIDGLRLSAERTGKYTGQLGPEWCGEDGVWKDIWTEQFPPTAARVGILRSDFAEPVWGKALYSEFQQDGEFWRGMPALMLSKCAEALGFRKAFPLQFSGLYTPEEMDCGQSISKRPPSISMVSGNSASPPRGAINPERGSGGYSSSPDVPPPLQPFFEAGLSDRRNLQAAYAFLQGELEHALGEAGLPTFRRIYAQHLGHGLFSSKTKCEAANRACMIELYAAVVRLPDSEAA